MHPRNIYSSIIDFKELAEICPDFKKHLTKNSTINFHDPDAVRELTKSLLKKDFGYDVELPADRLCPPVPNRLNYILWLQDLLADTLELEDGREVVGLDIGTGASAIYPLLGCSKSNWKFVATDIDEESIKIAKLNVENNGLSDRVEVIQTDGKKLIEFGSHEKLDFTICNPPFYASEQELIDSAKAKALPPSSACTGSPIEMVVEGGETAYILRVISESLELKDKVGWYTTMLGKLSSVSIVVEQLRKEKIGNYVIAEFIQGNGKTKRWAVGWSFGDRRVKDDIGRQPKTPKLGQSLPFPTAYRIPVPVGASKDEIAEYLNREFSSLPLEKWSDISTGSTGYGSSNGNVWSRAARRQMQRLKTEAAGTTTAGTTTAASENPFAFEVEHVLDTAVGDEEDIYMQEDGKDGDHMEWQQHEEELGETKKEEKAKTDPKHAFVVLHWKRGLDQTLWESFCGMVKRKTSERFPVKEKEEKEKEKRK